MAAKHIIIARTEGATAGLAAYMAAPISKQYPLYSELKAKRTDKTRLEHYCNNFGIKQTPPVTKPATASLEAQIEALRAQIEGNVVEVEIDPLEALKAQVAELQAIIAGKAPEAAKPRLLKPRPWDLTGKNVDTNGIFVNKGVKYRALTFEQAVEALEACYTANVRYTVRAS
jgi:hypothetical protein